MMILFIYDGFLTYTVCHLVNALPNTAGNNIFFYVRLQILFNELKIINADLKP